MKKIILILIGVIIIGGILFFLFSKKQEKTVGTTAEEELPPLEVIGSIADRGKIIIYTEGIGVVKPEKRAVYFSPVNSVVEVLNVYEGKYVKRGELLLKLKNDEQRANYEKALYNLKKAKASYEFSLKQERGDSSVLKVTTGFTNAKSAYERARKILERTQIYAPFDGKVGDISVSKGDMVKTGDKLFEIVDASQTKIIVELPDIEIEGVKRGRKAFIYALSSDKKYEGTVSGVSPVIDPIKKTGKVVIQSKVPFMIGSMVRVKIVSGEYYNKLRVPNEAVLHRENRDLVFVVRGGHAKWQWIKKGVEGEKYTEVLEGISVGDTVLTEGQFTIAHDAPVTVKIKNLINK